MHDNISDEARNNVILGIQKLEEKKCVVLTGACGFMIQQEEFIAENTKLPVVMSSLIQLPIVESMLPNDAKIGIVTSNGTNFNKYKTKLLTCAGVFPSAFDKFVIQGVEDIPEFKGIADATAVIYELALPKLIERVKEMLAAHPGIRAIVFECTELPGYAN